MSREHYSVYVVNLLIIKANLNFTASGLKKENWGFV